MNIALFADDTIIFTELRYIEAITTNLHVHLDTKYHWFKIWRIQINASKSIGVIFSLCCYRPPTKKKKKKQCKYTLRNFARD